MRIRELEEKRKNNNIETFKEFYKYFKKADYNLSLKHIIAMYKIYVK